MLFRSLLLAGVLMASGSHAQTAPVVTPQACSGMDVALPPELAGWTAKVPIAAAPVAAGLPAASLSLGKAYLAALPSTPAVTYVAQPEKAGSPASHGGLFRLTITSPGTYVVALGVGGWIDVLKDGAPVSSTSHGHGPSCTTLRKIVAFDLQPGVYVVQIAGVTAAELPIMAARRP